MTVALTIRARQALGEFLLDVDTSWTLQGVTALFGPSGSGKTSLLNVLAGFSRTGGRISYNSAVWEDGKVFVPPWRRPVGTVFQQSALFEHLTVAGNLNFASRRARSRKAGLEFDAVVAATGIEGLLQRRVGGLSGGETRRVAIARTLSSQPSLMLLDEPLVGLHDDARLALLDTIGSIPDRFSIPVIYVSHRIDEIAAIAANTAVMKGGKLVKSGRTQDVVQSLDVADIGSFSSSVILSVEFERYVEADALSELRLGEEVLWCPGGAGLARGSNVALRIRARDVALSAKRVEGTSIRNQLPVRVESISEIGPGLCELRLACMGQTLKAQVTRMAIRELALSVGDSLIALIKAAAFDSGGRA
ncbi:MAG: molybdenum ABC transporter ATP-binding protein [Pseudomonadota bacterium]